MRVSAFRSGVSVGYLPGLEIRRPILDASICAGAVVHGAAMNARAALARCANRHHIRMRRKALPMLSLLDCPNRVDDPEDDDLDGAPNAADGAYIDHGRCVPGYPAFVRWPALNDHGDRVTVLVGFPFIKSPRINAILANGRAE